MKESRIVFNHVWKKFHRGQLHDSLRDLIPAMVRNLAAPRNPAELHEGDFWAVRDLSFEVMPGETLGIIGPNGSGKSTTLKLLTRILAPTRGACQARGRVGTLIEVAAGFHGDLTGGENVFLQGAIMGMRLEDIRRKFDEIVEFAGIADAIGTPVKHYSSGMNARLGFSIAAHMEPDVLIIDEVLAVGDLSFQERAFGRIRDLARSGIPVVIVSHQLDRIAELCTDAILLNRGEVAARGTPDDVVAAYVSNHDAAKVVSSTGVVHLDRATLIGGGVVQSGGHFAVRIDGRLSESLPSDVEPIHLRFRSLQSGNVLFTSGTRRLGVDLSVPGPFAVTAEFQANVPAGSYVLEVSAHDVASHRDIATGPSTLLRVTDAGTFVGTVQLNARMARIEG
ncbi:MAG: ABC transporter ATP-binding protein [Gemmatimonadota bacterium]